MKTVSLEIAKALKDAGYPQPQTDVWGYVNRPNNCYFTGRHSYWADENREKRLEWDETNEFHTTDDWADEIEPSFYGSAIAAPTYLEVWLWLWRNKKIAIGCPYENTYNYWFTDINAENDKSLILWKYSSGEKEDPEEAIIAGINYLVENKLLNDEKEINL